MTKYNPVKVIMSDRLHTAAIDKINMPFIDLAKSIYGIDTNKVAMFVNNNNYNIVRVRNVGDIVELSLTERENGLEVIIKPTENMYPRYKNRGVNNAI